MPAVATEKKVLKQLIKEAMLETLREEPEMFREIVSEAMEDMALLEASKEGRRSGKATREEIFAALRS